MRRRLRKPSLIPPQTFLTMTTLSTMARWLKIKMRFLQPILFLPLILPAMAGRMVIRISGPRLMFCGVII